MLATVATAALCAALLLAQTPRPSPFQGGGGGAAGGSVTVNGATCTIGSSCAPFPQIVFSQSAINQAATVVVTAKCGGLTCPAGDYLVFPYAQTSAANVCTTTCATVAGVWSFTSGYALLTNGGSPLTIAVPGTATSTSGVANAAKWLPLPIHSDGSADLVFTMTYTTNSGGTFDYYVNVERWR